jgi:hypothetical protein
MMVGGELNGSQLTCTKLAGAAYEMGQSPDEIDGTFVDRTFGQSNSSIYANPNTEQDVLCVRGTDPSNQKV